MSETTAQTPAAEKTQTHAAAEAASSLVDTLFDLGVGWAATGLKIGKTALEQSAKTLENTAKALATLASELEKNEKTEAPPAKG